MRCSDKCASAMLRVCASPPPCPAPAGGCRQGRAAWESRAGESWGRGCFRAALGPALVLHAPGELARLVHVSVNAAGEHCAGCQEGRRLVRGASGSIEPPVSGESGAPAWVAGSSSGPQLPTGPMLKLCREERGSAPCAVPTPLCPGWKDAVQGARCATPRGLYCFKLGRGMRLCPSAGSTRAAGSAEANREGVGQRHPQQC